MIFAFTATNVFRFEADLPISGKLSKKVVEVFIKKPLPALPSGSFSCVNHHDVFFFNHKYTVGCRTTESSSHCSLSREFSVLPPKEYPTPRNSLCGAGMSNVP